MKLNLVVGDWSRDGHGMSNKYLYDVNLSKEALAQAFLDGCAKIGITKQEYSEKDFGFQFCKRYSDYRVPQSFIDKLVAAGLDPLEYFGEWEKEYSGEADMFPVLWLDIAKLGNPDLVYEQCLPDKTYYLGGYGLYSS